MNRKQRKHAKKMERRRLRKGGYTEEEKKMLKKVKMVKDLPNQGTNRYIKTKALGDLT